MNRSLSNVIFGGIAPTITSEGTQVVTAVKSDTYIRLDKGVSSDQNEHRRSGGDAWQC